MQHQSEGPGLTAAMPPQQAGTGGLGPVFASWEDTKRATPQNPGIIQKGNNTGVPRGVPLQAKYSLQSMQQHIEKDSGVPLLAKYSPTVHERERRHEPRGTSACQVLPAALDQEHRQGSRGTSACQVLPAAGNMSKDKDNNKDDEM